MQEYLASILTIGTSILTIGTAYGVTSSRIKQLELELEEVQEELKEVRNTYVTLNHFTAITQPIQKQITEIQRDIKSILLIVSGHNDPRRDKS